MNIYAPSDIEMKYVLNVYDNIADHFSKTRNTVWNAVKDFLESLPDNQNGIEIGFGNGKNMHYALNLGHNIFFNSTTASKWSIIMILSFYIKLIYKLLYATKIKIQGRI